MSCSTQADGVRVCHGDDGGGGSADLRLESFDDVPLELYVILRRSRGREPAAPQPRLGRARSQAEQGRLLRCRRVDPDLAGHRAVRRFVLRPDLGRSTSGRRQVFQLHPGCVALRRRPHTQARAARGRRSVPAPLQRNVHDHGEEPGPAAAGARTSRFGPGVTRPRLRHPLLAHRSGHREAIDPLLSIVRAEDRRARDAVRSSCSIASSKSWARCLSPMGRCTAAARATAFQPPV
jgi:hypothetical protein